MARTVRDTNLETRTARLRLAARPKPYWRTLETGFHLGYRRISTGSGSWIARRFIGDGKYAEDRIGLADDLQDADGSTVLNFRDAQNAAREWWKAKERLARGITVATGPYTVADALDDYFEARIRRGSKGTKADKHAANARIVPVLGHVEVDRLTTPMIRDWHQTLAQSSKLVRKKRLAPEHATKQLDATDAEAVRARRSTANRILTILKASLNFAFHEGRITADEVWRRVKPFREVDAPVIRFMTTDECHRLIAACEGSFKALVRGALFTGCRYGELIDMWASDFNPEARTVTVRFSKASKPRHVILNDEGRRFFSELTENKNGQDHIFLRDDGEKWAASHQQRPLTAASIKAGINPIVSFHILRHTHASSLAMRGVPMGVIAKQLGHSDTRMTERHYAHLSPSYVGDTIRAAMPSLELA